MDISIIKAFLDDNLSTRAQVERAAEVIGVSAATMYRYKGNPETISLGQAVKLSNSLGLPLASVAMWAPANVLESESRRLALESAISESGSGRRLQFVPAYTVNSELPEVTRLILQEDYGSRLSAIEGEMMSIRAQRAKLYEDGSYESWEIWNGQGYRDFFLGRGRFKSIPKELRERQIQEFVESSKAPRRHRFAFLNHSPDMPMFGCFTPPGVALIRIDNIQLEHRDPALVEHFEDIFNNFRKLCGTSTVDEFVDFLQEPCKFVSEYRP